MIYQKTSYSLYFFIGAGAEANFWLIFSFNNSTDLRFPDFALDMLTIILVLVTTSLGRSLTAPVDLGLAAGFAVLSKTGISTVPTSVITGDIGVSPIAGTAMTGFSLTAGLGYSTSAQVNGFCYAASYAAPTPAM